MGHTWREESGRSPGPPSLTAYDVNRLDDKIQERDRRNQANRVLDRDQRKSLAGGKARSSHGRNISQDILLRVRCCEVKVRRGRGWNRREDKIITPKGTRAHGKEPGGTRWMQEP